VESTWPNRDLPVLSAIVEIAERTSQGITPAMLVAETGLSRSDVDRALRALATEREPFFEYSDDDTGDVVAVANPTGQARRTVGQWPTPASLASEIIEALSKAADREPDPEQKSKLRAVVDFFAGVGRGVLTEVTTKAITTGAGL
jgi:hypothetical protein